MIWSTRAKWRSSTKFATRYEVYGHNCPEVDAWLDAVKSIMVACEKDDGIVEAYGTVLNQIARPENGYQPSAIRE